MATKILFLVSVLDALSFAMTLTVYAPCIRALGGSQFFLGLLGSMSALFNLIVHPIIGAFSDKIGRKTALLQLLLVCFLSNLTIAVTSSLTIVFISRILAGSGMQIGSLIKSLLDDNITNKNELSKSLNLMQALIGACFIFGALLGGFVSDTTNGIANTFYMISAIFAINIGLISLIEDKHKPTEHHDSISITRGLKMSVKSLTNLNWQKYGDIFLIKFLFDLMINAVFFNNQMVLEKFNLSGRVFGYMLAASGVIGIATNVAMAKFKDVYYAKDASGSIRFLHGNILFITAFLLQVWTSDFLVYFLSSLPIFAGRVLVENTITEVLLSRAPSSEKGTVMGTFDSSFSLTGLIVPLMSGLTASTFGEGASILIYCLLPAVIAVILSHKQSKSNKIN